MAIWHHFHTGLTGILCKHQFLRHACASYWLYAYGHNIIACRWHFLYLGESWKYVYLRKNPSLVEFSRISYFDPFHKSPILTLLDSLFKHHIISDCATVCTWHGYWINWCCISPIISYNCRLENHLRRWNNVHNKQQFVIWRRICATTNKVQWHYAPVNSFNFIYKENSFSHTAWVWPISLVRLSVVK